MFENLRLWVRMGVIQAEVMAWQEQTQDEKGEAPIHPTSQTRGRPGPRWGHRGVRQGREGGLGTGWGHVFPPRE